MEKEKKFRKTTIIVWIICLITNILSAIINFIRLNPMGLLNIATIIIVIIFIFKIIKMWSKEDADRVMRELTRY